MLFLVAMLWLGPAVAAAADAPVILVFGDSLSAAYGIPREAGWVQLLQQRLRQRGYPHRVVNGSVTGETTSGGLARLPSALKEHRPALVLLELGGNDGLRGLPLQQLRTNLAKLAQLSRAAGARVLVFEMRMPPNYGAAYADGFQQAFATVAREQGATLVPFFLEPIATDERQFLADGIHPAAGAQGLLLDAVWPVLHSVLVAPPASGERAQP